MTTATRPVGDLVREWRQRRRWSQMELAAAAGISTRHLSFIETGRSTPSREMVLRLAERLDVPPRLQNVLLVAAGHAPEFPERPLDDPALARVRQAVALLLAGHEPFPALAVDRHWTIVAANRAMAPFVDGVDPSLLQSPMNALRLSLHPAGVAPRIVNYHEWREHVLTRVRRQVEISADPVLADLAKELAAYPVPSSAPPASRDAAHEYAGVIVPLRVQTPGGMLSFLSTTTIFGTPIDVTLSELALETFVPADAATAAALGTPRPA